VFETILFPAFSLRHYRLLISSSFCIYNSSLLILTGKCNPVVLARGQWTLHMNDTYGTVRSYTEATCETKTDNWNSQVRD